MENFQKVDCADEEDDLMLERGRMK